MPHTRCMWYEDDGKPIERGCSSLRGGRHCPFVHPDDKDWDSAKRGKKATIYPKKAYQYEDDGKLDKLAAVKSALRRGHQGPPKPNFDRSTWGASSTPNHTNDQASFDRSTWGASSSGPSHTNEQASFDRSTWGASSASSHANDQTFSTSTSALDGWKPPAPTKTIGWNDDPGRANNSGSGTGTGWGSPQTSTWGSSGWRLSPDADSGTSWVPSGSPPPPSLPPPPLPPLHVPAPTPITSINRPAPPKSILRMPSITSTLALTPIATLPMEKAIMGPPPVPSSAKGKEVHGTRYKHPTQMLDRVATPITQKRTDQSRRHRSPSRSIFKPEKHLKIGRKPSTPAERKRLYRNVIKQIQTLVCLTVLHRDKQAQYLKWKDRSAARLYLNSSLGAREKLNEVTHRLRKEMDDIWDRRQRHLNHLICLPDIPTKPKAYDFEGDRKKIVSYTMELRSWIIGLDLPRRLQALQYQPEDEDHVPPTTNQVHDDQMAVDEPVAKTQWTPQLIRATIKEIEKGVRDIEGSINLAMYTDLSDYNEPLQQFRKVVRERRHARQLQQVRKVTVAQKTDLLHFDARLKSGAEQSVQTCARIRRMQEYVAGMKEKVNQLREQNDEDDARIAELTRQGEEKRKRIDEVAELLRQVAANRKPRAPRRVRQFTVEDISQEFRHKLVNRITEEIKPVLQGVVDGATADTEKVKAHIDQLLEPLLARTQKLCDQIDMAGPPPSASTSTVPS
ncbi:hypothetical protein FA15DRAFT_667118 [Coprinopsis marcescibilis]|uniref:Uncharacterized protein n=1 Tax=Coprinopsis marcescibilis TaxID=230819 RepID=A0A5C3L3B5_COPMA|nr:hypothetical protein FA15DRAFT_667118 [Coprinopsis marcescibilis]